MTKRTWSYNLYQCIKCRSEMKAFNDHHAMKCSCGGGLLYRKRIY